MQLINTYRNKLVDKAAEDPDLDPFFTEEMYENRYKTDYLNSYWAIIIPFGQNKKLLML